MPRVKIVARPARMMTSDTARAGHFQRRKWMCGFFRICMALLNGERRHLAAIRQSHFEQGLRDEGRGEDVRNQTNRQRDREAPDWSGAELEEEGRGDEGRDVRVDKR